MSCVQQAARIPAIWSKLITNHDGEYWVVQILYNESPYDDSDLELSGHNGRVLANILVLLG